MGDSLKSRGGLNTIGPGGLRRFYRKFCGGIGALWFERCFTQLGTHGGRILLGGKTRGVKSGETPVKREKLCGHIWGGAIMGV